MCMGGFFMQKTKDISLEIGQDVTVIKDFQVKRMMKRHKMKLAIVVTSITILGIYGVLMHQFIQLLEMVNFYA